MGNSEKAKEQFTKELGEARRRLAGLGTPEVYAKASMKRDLVIAAIAVILSGFLSAMFDIYERFYKLTRTLENWQLDEIPFVIFIFVLCCIWFAYRRMREHHREIRHRRHKEEELRSSEERFNILFEYAPDGYYLNDLKGNFVDGNRAAEEIVGYKREELIGKNFLTLHLLPPKQIPKAAKLLARNAMGQPTGPDELTLNRKDGKQVVVEIRTFPVNIKDQLLVLGIARDITRRKKVEQELRTYRDHLEEEVGRRTAELQAANRHLQEEIAERERTEEALKESEDRYRLVVENANEAIAVAQDGMVQFANVKLEELTGRPKDELTSRPFSEFIHPDDREMVAEIHRQRLAGESVPTVYSFRSIDRDENVKWLESNAVLITWEGRPATLTFLNDITERRKVEEALQKAHDELGQRVKERTAELSKANEILEEKDRMLAAFHQIGQAILSSLDLEQILDNLTKQIVEVGIFRALMIALVDEEAQTVEVMRSLRYETRGGVILPDRTLVSAENVIGLRYSLDDDNITAHVVRTGEVHVIEGWDERFDHRVDQPEKCQSKISYFVPVKKGNQVLAVLATGSRTEEKEEVLGRIEAMKPLLDQVAVALEHARFYREAQEHTAELKAVNEQLQKEIAERRQAEEMLADFSRHTIQLQEEERRRVGRELHDGVNQVLSGLRFRIEGIEDRISPTDKDALDEVERAEQLLDDAIQEIRRISQNLRPSILDDLGLMAAARSLCDGFADRTQTAIDLKSCQFPSRLSRELETTLYRILQEALSNIEKHAQATQVKISLFQEDSCIAMRVRDDGKGFEMPSKGLGKQGSGLSNMKERVALVDGELVVQSIQGRGTELIVKLPFDIGGQSDDG